MQDLQKNAIHELKLNIQHLLVGEIDSDFSLFHVLSKRYSELKYYASNEILDELTNLHWEYCVDEKIIAIASEWFSVITSIAPTTTANDLYKTIIPSNFSKIAALSYAFLMDFFPDRRKNLNPRLHFWLGLPYAKNQIPPVYGTDISYIEYALIQLGVDQNKAERFKAYAQTIATMDEKNGRDIKYLLPVYHECIGHPPNIDMDLDISEIF